MIKLKYNILFFISPPYHPFEVSLCNFQDNIKKLSNVTMPISLQNYYNEKFYQKVRKIIIYITVK